MSITSVLVDLEKGFWSGDEVFYREHLDETCQLAIPGMVGIYRRGEIAAMAKSGHSWRSLRISERGLVQPAPGVALITYEVNAENPAGEPHHAIASTLYVRVDGEWKMRFHQQTPATEKAAASAAA